MDIGFVEHAETLNPFLARPIMNIPVASWLIAFTAMIVSYIAMQFVLSYFRSRLKKNRQGQAADSNAYHVRDVLLEILGGTSKLALAVTSLLIGVALLDLPERWGDKIHNLWFLAFGLQLALWINKAIAIAARRYFLSITPAAGESATTVSQTLTVWGLQALLWIVFFLAMLANVGVNITAFVASLGIGGVAIALAVQNILGDLFASLSIAMDKPFEVGDAINVDGKSGTVEHVGLKTTRIRADSGEQIVIANSALLKTTILNYKRMQNRRIQFELVISFDNPPDLAEKIPALIRKIIEAQPSVRFDRAHFKNFTPHSMHFDIVYFMVTADYMLYMDTQQRINIALLKELGKLGVSFTPPIQSMYMLPDRNDSKKDPQSATPLRVGQGSGANAKMV
ncbi:mechanosensitive ion channel family protein [Undibacterium sp. TJN25]|uniref:mechanosensitive ion channel family protein n=1 Tax=Undibacterium sp. TJN25 TaxID=3413056 RepID=UPI003BF26D12